MTVNARAPLPETFAGIQDVHYPLVLPMRQLLDMLNASLPHPFTAGGVQHNQRAVGRSSAAAAVGADDNSSSSSSDSSDMEDEVADGAARFDNNAAPAARVMPAAGSFSAASFPALQRSSMLPASRYSADAAGLEVDFDIFLGQYWSRFDTRLKQGLDPSMVFAGESYCSSSSSSGDSRRCSACGGTHTTSCQLPHHCCSCGADVTNTLAVSMTMTFF
jgi:hypothetical protein